MRGALVPRRGRESRQDHHPFEEDRVTLYCYRSIKTWERSIDGTRRYIDRGGFAHRGSVYRLSRFWSRHLRRLLIRAFTGARWQAEERGGTEHKRRVYIAGAALRGPPEAAGTEIVNIAAVIDDLTRKKVRETSLLDRSHFVDDQRELPAMVCHPSTAHGRFSGG